MENANYLGIVALQLGLSQLRGENGDAYYVDAVDGQAGPATRAAIYDLAKDLGMTDQERVSWDVDANMVLVFSLAEDADKKVSEHFTVREFACKDGSDTVFMHPVLPVWAEEIRKINGPFSPSSAYRTPSHNQAVGGAGRSRHTWGTAIDIPAVNATPEELYLAAEEILGDTGGLGLYSWGIHMDTREEKARWKG